MRLLVTGGLGFIGSNFILNVLKNHDKFEIINIDDQLPGSNLENLVEVKNYRNYTYVKGNITNSQLVESLVSQSDAIINFAAESHVDRSISDARPFIDSNIVGAFTILEAVKKYDKKLIQISTDEVFGSLVDKSANEDHKLNPSSPYSSSKAAAELLANSYFVTYGIKVIITRCTNNYGPRQSAEKLIPKTILNASKNQKIPVYGSGRNIRDWIFVDDHCEGILEVLSNGRDGESYNISANNEIENLTIIKKILEIMGKSEDLIEFVRDRPGHDFRYSLDSTKIRNMGWKTRINFEEGIKKTIDWYLANKNWVHHVDEKLLTKNPWKS